MTRARAKDGTTGRTAWGDVNVRPRRKEAVPEAVRRGLMGLIDQYGSITKTLAAVHLSWNVWDDLTAVGGRVEAATLERARGILRDHGVGTG